MSNIVKLYHALFFVKCSEGTERTKGIYVCILLAFSKGQYKYFSSDKAKKKALIN